MHERKLDWGKGQQCRSTHLTDQSPIANVPTCIKYSTSGFINTYTAKLFILAPEMSYQILPERVCCQVHHINLLAQVREQTNFLFFF